MEKIILSDGAELSRVTAGCMRTLQAGLSGESLRSFVHSCLDMGVDTFDHAPVYARGECERVFGEDVIGAEPGIRDRMKIITKCGIFPAGTVGNKVHFYDSRKQTIIEEMDRSLKRLHTDHVDVLLVHRPDLMSDPSEIAEALEQLVKEGKALHVGVSNYEAPLFDALQQFSKVPIELNQVEFSAAAVDNFFNGTVECAFRHGTHLMAWSPLGGGGFFTGTDEKHVRLRETVGSIAADHGVAEDVILYAWLMKHPVNMMVVTGTMKAERVAAAVKALEVELSYDEWYQIMGASRGFQVP